MPPQGRRCERLDTSRKKTLRLSVLHNRILVRAQAAFVALIYVFLCTFGTLTHVHSGAEEGFSHTASAAHQNHTFAPGSSSYLASAIVSTQSTPAPTHCAFCEWQANTLGRISTPSRSPVPTNVACIYVRRCTRIAPVFTTLSSSRAPPAV